MRDQRTWAIACFLCAIFTDTLDGHLARRLGVGPSLGPYLDAAADFVFVLAAFSAFVYRGLYPRWTLLLLVAMFLQFVFTSGRERPVYDPVGKYYGVFLFASIALTLAFPRPEAYRLVLIGMLVFTAGSLASRYAFFRRTAG